MKSRGKNNCPLCPTSTCEYGGNKEFQYQFKPPVVASYCRLMGRYLCNIDECPLPKNNPFKKQNKK